MFTPAVCVGWVRKGCKSQGRCARACVHVRARSCACAYSVCQWMEPRRLGRVELPAFCPPARLLSLTALCVDPTGCPVLCSPCFAVQSWIEEMSGHLRQLDPNHLITVGAACLA